MTPTEFFSSLRFFGEPKVPEGYDLPKLIATYVKELKRYSGDVLSAASDRMIKLRTFRNFPLPAECVKVCDEVRSEFIEMRQSECSRKAGDEAWSEARIRQADRLMDSDLGRRAADEGWIIALHDFCRENGRLPQGGEAARVRLEALARKRQREDWAQMPNGNPKIIQPIARAMAAKSNRLSGIAYGR